MRFFLTLRQFLAQACSNNLKTLWDGIKLLQKREKSKIYLVIPKNCSTFALDF